jgi:hypothetical protein
LLALSASTTDRTRTESDICQIVGEGADDQRAATAGIVAAAGVTTATAAPQKSPISFGNPDDPPQGAINGRGLVSWTSRRPGMLLGPAPEGPIKLKESVSAQRCVNPIVLSTFWRISRTKLRAFQLVGQFLHARVALLDLGPFGHDGAPAVPKSSDFRHSRNVPHLQ